MEGTSLISADDRARGWMDLEVDFTDGSREAVRVHFLEESEFLKLAVPLSPGDAVQQTLMKMLRQDADYVARLTGNSQMMISAIQLACLSKPGEEEKAIGEGLTYALQELKSNG